MMRRSASSITLSTARPIQAYIVLKYAAGRIKWQINRRTFARLGRTHPSKPSETIGMGITRRRLLEQVGAVGGAGAAYLAMEALGLAIATPAGAENFQLPPRSGKGRSVVILGAGI